VHSSTNKHTEKATTYTSFPTSVFISQLCHLSQYARHSLTRSCLNCS